jgi:hypothetical protein
MEEDARTVKLLLLFKLQAKRGIRSEASEKVS